MNYFSTYLKYGDFYIKSSSWLFLKILEDFPPSYTLPHWWEPTSLLLSLDGMQISQLDISHHLPSFRLLYSCKLPAWPCKHLSRSLLVKMALPTLNPLSRPRISYRWKAFPKCSQKEILYNKKPSNTLPYEHERFSFCDIWSVQLQGMTVMTWIAHPFIPLPPGSLESREI